MLSSYKWIDLNDQTINLDQISIFKTFIPDVIDEVAKVEDHLLSHREKIKATRFKFIADKNRFCTGRVVLKLLLNNLSGLSLAGLDLNLSANGKPSFKDVEFNISHSENYVLVVVADKSVGIDVEIPKENFDFDPILKNTFCIDELSYINYQPLKKERFLTLWTRKEALLKATGEGLTDDLTSISVLDEQVDRMGLKYAVKSFKINDRDIASVAYLHTDEKVNCYEIKSIFFNFFT